MTWDGGAGTVNWEDAANWDTDSLPLPADDVVIADLPTAGYTFMDLDSFQSIHSLSLIGTDFFQNQAASLRILPGRNLSVGTTIDVQNSFLELFASTLSATTVTLATSGFLDGASAVVSANVVNNNGTLSWSSGGYGLAGTPFTINGNYTQGPLGNFTADIDAIANTADVVQVTGVANLDGYFTLNSLTNDPIDVSQNFNVLQFGSATGSFNSLSWYNLGYNLATPYVLNQNLTGVDLAGNVRVVSSTSNAGLGSLRQAIIDANVGVDPTLIGFRNIGTINLTSSLPDATQPLEINENARRKDMHSFSAKELSQFNFPISTDTSPTRKRGNLTKMQ